MYVNNSGFLSTQLTQKYFFLDMVHFCRQKTFLNKRDFLSTQTSIFRQSCFFRQQTFLSIKKDLVRTEFNSVLHNLFLPKRYFYLSHFCQVRIQFYLIKLISVENWFLSIIVISVNNIEFCPNRTQFWLSKFISVDKSYFRKNRIQHYQIGIRTSLCMILRRLKTKSDFCLDGYHILKSDWINSMSHVRNFG